MGVDGRVGWGYNKEGRNHRVSLVKEMDFGRFSRQFQTGPTMDNKVRRGKGEKAREQEKRLATEDKCIYFPKEGGQRHGQRDSMSLTVAHLRTCPAGTSPGTWLRSQP